MKKTNRKNKTNLVVNWPNGHYTVDSLFAENPDFIKITLRVRLNKAISDKSVAVIGTRNGGKGRPKLVFTSTPVTKDVIDAAKQDGVLVENESTLVNIVAVSNQPEPTEPTQTVVTTTPVQSVVVNGQKVTA
jgi:hypothetical protein